MSAHRRPRSPQVIVKVTQEIIDRAERANSRTCMIAEAIKIAVPGATVVSVDIQTCRFTDPVKGLRYVYLTPPRGQKPLLDFDEGSKPEPFEIKLQSAHVLKARQSSIAPYSIAAEKVRDRVPNRATTRLNVDNTVSRIGGRAPPQMRTQRKFGLRAFVGLAKPDVASKSKE